MDRAGVLQILAQVRTGDRPGRVPPRACLAGAEREDWPRGGFLQIDQTKLSHTSLTALHTWLDNWTGIGHIVVGMERPRGALMSWRGPRY